jgi:UDP-glucose 4-epimerase
VTGGAGFLGSHLVDELVGRGEGVIVMDNMRRGSPANIARHLASGAVRLVIGDIRNEEDIERAIEGAELVYHLAAQSNVMGAIVDADYCFQTNVAGTYNILKAAKTYGVRRVVFSSSREVYGEPAEIPVPETAPKAPKNPYGASKAAGEIYCDVWGSTGLEVQVLRFANVYGARDRERVIPTWIERAISGGELELYGGEQIIDFIWVGTAVEALTAAALLPQTTSAINVGSGVGTRLHDLADRILEMTGSVSVKVLLPSRTPEVARFVADVQRLRSVLGIEPDGDPLGHLDSLLNENLVRGQA